MTLFYNLNHKQTTLECAWQHFETQSSFWIKVYFDPMVRWRGLDKIKVYRIYNTLFQCPYCLMFMIHETWLKKKKIEMPTYKISFFSYGSDFFF